MQQMMYENVYPKPRSGDVVRKRERSKAEELEDKASLFCHLAHLIVSSGMFL